MAIIPITPGDDLPEAALIAVPKRQLDDIGDAIRAKRDTVAKIEIPDMPMEIEMIEGGIGKQLVHVISADGTLSAEALTAILAPYVSGGFNLFLLGNPPENGSNHFIGLILKSSGEYLTGFRGGKNAIYTANSTYSFAVSAGDRIYYYSMED